MAPLPQNSTIDHFSHPGHPLSTVDSDREFVCDGCKTGGSGRRYRCHGCDFDLHDYCGTCPRLLSSFMHHHSLTLVIRKAQATRQLDRFCDVCRDPVEGLFYRCKECEFDVHPLCTQLPEKLHHALHKIHPLILQSSPLPGSCCVCRNPCNGWRYRCGICNFDIHLECVLAPVVPMQQEQMPTGQTDQRGIPMFGQRAAFRPPPQFAPNYGFPHGPGYPNHGHGYPNYGYGYNPYQGGPHMYPQQNYMPQHNQVSGSSGNSSSSGSSRLGKSMFSLVGQLGFGVVSNMIFGVDITALFAG